MNKQELIERIEGLKNLFGNKAEYIEIDSVIELVSKLDEPQEIVVQQFVADWYEEHKDDFEYNIWDWIKYSFEEDKRRNKQFIEWIGNSDNKPVETLVKMSLYGYTVEKEKRYLVKMKDLETGFNFLNFQKEEDHWLFSSKDETTIYHSHHTRKELEEAGFGEVFDSPLFEVEEVEE
ncbi:MAG: DUF1642 domain-containing protein [Streptococcus parasanguinis]|nr:DUF1642 domain-containing protein [Streptococcus parasanguinis]